MLVALTHRRLVLEQTMNFSFIHLSLASRGLESGYHGQKTSYGRIIESLLSSVRLAKSLSFFLEYSV